MQKKSSVGIAAVVAATSQAEIVVV